MPVFLVDRDRNAELTILQKHAILVVSYSGVNINTSRLSSAFQS